MDLSTVTQANNDCGLLGLVFHPEFGLPFSTNRGFLYVWYSYSPAPTLTPTADTRMYNRLSRFSVPDDSLAVDPASELVLINQFDRHFWHNGGGMFFGADGFLYVSNGDEGAANDTFNQTQTITNGFFSGVFRIDVDRIPTRSHPIRRQIRDGGGIPSGWPPSYSANYFVPNDNPWQDASGGVLEEFFAIGLRSPHRMTLDPPTGRIWVGDVGQGLQEEVDLIQKGGNYQWAFREGSLPGPKSEPALLIGTSSPPLYSYGRTVGRCIIGGHVYRGAQYAPELSECYIFGDYISGKIWSLAYDGVSAPVVTTLCSLKQFSLSSFGLDQTGELYVCSVRDGKILKLNRRPEPAPIQVVSIRTVFDRLELNFTNLPGLSFSVMGTTNLALPLDDWTALGPISEISPGLYNFTNTVFTNRRSGFFRVRQP